MKTRARPVPWLPCDEAALAKLYPDYEGEVLARVFGRSVASIEGKANELRLRKSAAYKAKAYKRSRFQKGHVPANKGRKGYVAPGCEKGWFKRGEVNGRARQLWVPVGSHRINADGYLDRKVSDEPGPQTLRWKPLHRLVWAEAHGPIPKGHCVAFKPGRFSTDPALITLDALELITQAENMRRNTVHNLPPELRQVVQLRGALNRRINTLTGSKTS